jgi:uncharacterized SAM-binding protein YcdF (DUF218 family)
VVLLLLLGLWWMRRRPVAARRALLAGVAMGLFVGWMPLPDALLRRLENRFGPPQGSLQHFVGMVVLGGAVASPQIQRASGGVALSNVSERLTVPLTLMQQYPQLRMLYVGREDPVFDPDGNAVNKARLFFKSLGLDERRAIFEEASRNTYENAVLGAATPGINKSQRWLLVTSARHMPRALSTFRAAGWNVIPYPVDYLTSSETEWNDYSMSNGTLRWQAALREYLGWGAYSAMGRAGP